MKGHVLVIDDEAEIRRNLTFGLMAEGYGVTACPDGISAIHELDRAREKGQGYDYLVTDIFMPDIDGLKILKVIKSQYPDLPVVVITGFGDESLRFEALSEHNVEYLDKPFEIEDLVARLDSLQARSSTLHPMAVPEPAVRESLSAYLTIRITDPALSMDVFQRLSRMDGVESCEAVRGDVDIIVLAHAPSREGIEAFFQEVRAIPGVDVVSVSPVERPRLDRDVGAFMDLYRSVLKQKAAEGGRKAPATTSYVIIDIDPGAIQQIFTTVFFIDDVIFCDVIDGGRRLVGMITGQGAVGRTSRVVERISQIDGVLRVRVANIIKMNED